jgi:hypothetical protein
MTSFKGKASKAKMLPPWGQTSNTGVEPDQQVTKPE